MGGSLHVDAHQRPGGIPTHLRRVPVPSKSGTTDEDIDRGKFALDRPISPPAFCFAGEVGRHGSGAATFMLYSTAQLPKAVTPTRDDRDVVSLARQHQGRGGADPR